MKTIRPQEDTKFSISVGEPFAVELPSGGATGYEWSVELDDPSVIVIGSVLTPSLDSIGAAGEKKFEFKAMNHGQCHVVFQLKRSWETEVAKELTVEVNIR